MTGLDLTPAQLTLSSNAAVCESVAVGLGVTLISRDAVARDLAEGRLVELAAPGAPLERDWYLLAHRSGPPATARLLPLDSPAKLLAMGAVWGWLPCGMVYSVLLTAMLSGSALSSAPIPTTMRRPIQLRAPLRRLAALRRSSRGDRSRSRSAGRRRSAPR